jgi:hypothetical protein
MDNISLHDIFLEFKKSYITILTIAFVCMLVVIFYSFVIDKNYKGSLEFKIMNESDYLENYGKLTAFKNLITTSQNNLQGQYISEETGIKEIFSEIRYDSSVKLNNQLINFLNMFSNEKIYQIFLDYVNDQKVLFDAYNSLNVINEEDFQDKQSYQISVNEVAAKQISLLQPILTYDDMAFTNRNYNPYHTLVAINKDADLAEEIPKEIIRISNENVREYLKFNYSAFIEIYTSSQATLIDKINDEIKIITDVGELNKQNKIEELESQLSLAKAFKSDPMSIELMGEIYSIEGSEAPVFLRGDTVLQAEIDSLKGMSLMPDTRSKVLELKQRKMLLENNYLDKLDEYVSQLPIFSDKFSAADLNLYGMNVMNNSYSNLTISSFGILAFFIFSFGYVLVKIILRSDI